jgi:hypothetical protein
MQQEPLRHHAFLASWRAYLAEPPSWCPKRGVVQAEFAAINLSAVHGSLSATAWAPCRRRRGICLHREQSIEWRLGKVQCFYFVGIMHKRHAYHGGTSQKGTHHGIWGAGRTATIEKVVLTLPHFGSDNPSSRYHPLQFCLSTRRSVVLEKDSKALLSEPSISFSEG